MSKLRGLSVVLGIVAFVAAYVIDHGAWFLNSSRGVMIAGGCTIAAGFLAALGGGDRREAMTRGVNVGIGGVVAMLVSMGIRGAGTLAPIVFVVGTAILLAAGVAGGSVMAIFKKA